jgi:hypothetical protein
MYLDARFNGLLLTLLHHLFHYYHRHLFTARSGVKRKSAAQVAQLTAALLMQAAWLADPSNGVKAAATAKRSFAKKNKTVAERRQRLQEAEAAAATAAAAAINSGNSVGGASALVTFICVLFFGCSLGGASALATIICVLCSLRTQISRSINNFTHYRLMLITQCGPWHRRVLW